MHMMREIPKYKDIDEKHYKESRELDKYREEQFDKALQLFVENIRDLWSQQIEKQGTFLVHWRAENVPFVHYNMSRQERETVE